MKTISNVADDLAMASMAVCIVAAMVLATCTGCGGTYPVVTDKTDHSASTRVDGAEEDGSDPNPEEADGGTGADGARDAPTLAQDARSPEASTDATIPDANPDTAAYEACRAGVCSNPAACGRVDQVLCEGLPVDCGRCNQDLDADGHVLPPSQQGGVERSGICGDNGVANRCGQACAAGTYESWCGVNGHDSAWAVPLQCNLPWRETNDALTQTRTLTKRPGGTAGCHGYSNAGVDVWCCP